MKIEINDKQYEFPTSWDEMTLEQYCKIYHGLKTATEDMDDIEAFRLNRENEAVIISRVLGEKDDFCLGLPLGVYAYLNEQLRFLYGIDEFMDNAKAGITIKGKRYSVPKFDEMQLRQYIDADVVMKGEDDNLQYIRLLSVLLLTKENGKWSSYDGEREDLFNELRNTPCSVALPLVMHFFKKSHALQKLTQAYSKAQGQTHQQHLLTANS